MTDVRFPCGSFPSCGLTHARPFALTDEIADEHDFDHADRYIELVRKLRDRHVMTSMIIMKLGSLHGPTAARIYDDLMDYLDLSVPETP